MKTISNNLMIALFLAFISQGIQAQFDDIYYDPDKDTKFVRDDYDQRGRDATPDYRYEEAPDESYSGDDYYDNDYGEWEDQDYYYTSRIKRFHRPVYGFGYYDPFYTYNYFYDPFDFDPWYYDRDIYSSGWTFQIYSSPFRWRNYYSYRPFWSYWDACLGWNNYPFGYYGGYYGYHHGYWGNQGYYYHSPYHHSNNHHRYRDTYADNGYHYGSRRFGTTQTSKRGPVRLSNPSPRVITEATGVSPHSGKTIDSPRRLVRSADGETPNVILNPRNAGSDKKPERVPPTTRRLPVEKSDGVNNDRFDERNSHRLDDSETRFPDRKTEERKSGMDRFRPHRMERKSPFEESGRTPSIDRDNRSGRDRSAQPEMNLPRQKGESDRSGLGGAILEAIGGSRSKGNNSSSGSGSGKSNKSEGSRKAPR